MRLLVDTNIFLEILLEQNAYQYAVAERYGLAIVSLDGDFDRTARGRIQPVAVV